MWNLLVSMVNGQRKDDLETVTRQLYISRKPENRGTICIFTNLPYSTVNNYLS